MRNRLRFLALLAALALVAAACGEGGERGGGQPGPPAAGAYPRNETLYTSGTQWGPPSNWNPIMTWQYATGTVGLVYETLFLYDPLKDEFTPWLAESGDWVSGKVYELKLRKGVTWSDGKPFTAQDVVFTVELGKFESVPYHPLWEWLERAEAVDDHTVRFTFSDPRYQQWANWLYFHAIVPKHLWEGRSEQEVTTGANLKPVGTGPYLYHTHSQDRMVWVKNDKWWARQQLNLDVKPKYVVDIVNSSNDVALSLVLQGGIDLSNNFLPGIASLIKGGYGIKTYYPDAPYMLAANTTWLILNTTRKPMDDAAFRRALAFAIDTGRIASGVYGNIVQPANPTGLLPIWEKYIDQSVVDELGFKYDPAEARRILASAGYRDRDGDGLVEAPDGAKIELTFLVQNGWTDWMEASRVIVESARAAGINLRAELTDPPAIDDARLSGNFDLLMNNERQMDNTPWMYYEYIFRLPVQERQSTVNFGRYENEQAWELVQRLDRVPVDDLEGMREVISQLQRIQLEEMPLIPLWYNGLWAQYNTKVWTNWPSAEDGTPDYVPSTWRGYFQRGSVLMLTELQPAPKQ